MNLPNKLSFLRIGLVPVMMFFYLASFIPYGKIIAVVLFIVAALTDLYDGKIARERGMVTSLGKLLDPLADKMLYTCSLFLIVADGTIASPWGVIALTIMFFRDTLVNGIRQVGATKGVVVSAAWSGKVKSALTYIYIPVFMFISQGIFANTGYQACDIINLILTIIAYAIMAVACATTIWSAIDYTLINKDLIIQKEETSKKEQIEETNASESNSSKE